MGESSVDDNTEVRVSDGSGNLLGFGQLSNCPACKDTFEAKATTDGFYQVTVGGLNSKLSYTDADVKNGVLEVGGSIGM